ncbi:hypothetical protein [Planktothricoides sp. SR001]|nr:hypothetical protein [Planktothricoides sp. SR001]
MTDGCCNVIYRIESLYNYGGNYGGLVVDLLLIPAIAIHRPKFKEISTPI